MPTCTRRCSVYNKAAEGVLDAAAHQASRLMHIAIRDFVVRNGLRHLPDICASQSTIRAMSISHILNAIYCERHMLGPGPPFHILSQEARTTTGQPTWPKAWSGKRCSKSYLDLKFFNLILSCCQNGAVRSSKQWIILLIVSERLNVMLHSKPSLPGAK